MKAELIPEETFTVKVGDHHVPGMRIVSKWNGLIELRNAWDEVLIVTAAAGYSHASAFEILFGDVFGVPQGATAKNGTVIVMGSPDLLERLRAALTTEPDPRGAVKV